MTEQQLSHYEVVNGSAEPSEPWRNEVQDRLAHYKRRRGRRIEGAYTMRFPFPAQEPTSASAPVAFVPSADPGIEVATAPSDEDSGSVAVAEAELEPRAATSPLGEQDGQPSQAVEEEPAALVLSPPPLVEEDDKPFVDPFHRPRPKRKVIAFPKQSSVVSELTYVLADPVTSDVPRILDVPEELEAIPATPFLEGLQLGLPTHAAAEQRDEHIELPFHAVTRAQRLLAGTVDLAVIGIATAWFAAIAYQVLHRPASSKYLVLGLAAAAVVLWAAYQYLFLVHAGKTLGMMAAGIRVCTFRGKAPSLRQRRNRVLGFYLSSLSLGMGLLWAFVDVDGLCWHDRLSHTYLSPRG
jgi:uncharacterized RDD family membrane protein YckC